MDVTPYGRNSFQLNRQQMETDLGIPERELQNAIAILDTAFNRPIAEIFTNQTVETAFERLRLKIPERSVLKNAGFAWFNRERHVNVGPDAPTPLTKEILWNAFRILGNDDVDNFRSHFNQGPIVKAGSDRTANGNEVALDGTVTDDGKSGRPLIVQWSKLSGPGVVSFSNEGVTNTAAKFSERGTYVLHLQAHNGLLYAGDTVTVTVNELNSAPVLSGIQDRTAAAGDLVSLTVSSTDADLPANTLTYTLEPGAPQGAAIDPVSGAFAWTPAAAQAGTTNQITIRVTDNGVPPLLDTKSFTVVVAAQASAPVQLNASLLSNGDVRLVWTATPGRAYVLQRSSDLADWQDLITLNAVGDSLEHIDAAMPGAAMRFYRVVQR